MNTSLITSLLFVAGCLVGHLGWAQQAPIALLAPVAPVVAPPKSTVGVEIQPKQPVAPVPTATAPPQSRPTILEPVVILNGRYLTGMTILGTLSPQQIDKVEIYKPGTGSMQWRSLTTLGIISIEFKVKTKLKLKARSLAALKRGLGLRGPVRFEFNGAHIQDESLQIITSTIAGLDVTQAMPGTATKAIVNIRSVPFKPAGPQAAPAQPVVYPPGTIMIRGLAQH
ncbi:MAG: hypothetical protein EOO62_32015 [Hymenobacter sp.]|nr:MAG: hypothetical protein EOO62_32015 [Hymenobacter sp.]